MTDQQTNSPDAQPTPRRALVAAVLLSLGVLGLFGVQAFASGPYTWLVGSGVLLLMGGILWVVIWLWRQWQASQTFIDTQQTLHEAGHFTEQTWQTRLTAVEEENEQLWQKQELNSKLLTLARATANTYTLDDTLHSILRVTSRLTDAEIGSLLILDATGQVTDSITSYPNAMTEKVTHILGKVMDEGLAGWVFRERVPALIRDTRQDERWIVLPDAPYQAGSVLSVPILHDDMVSGILTLVHHTHNHFHEADVTLMRSAADQLAQTLGNAQVFEGQRRLLERQTAVSDILQAISTHLNPRDVMQATVDSALDLTDWPLVATYIPDPEQQQLVRHAYNRDADAASFAAFSPDVVKMDDESLVVKAFMSQTRQVNFNTHDHTAVIALPLSWRQDRLGVFYIAHPQPYGLDDNDLLLATALAESISLALHNAYLFRAVSDERGRLQALIENTRGAVIMMGLDERILVINQTALDQFQLTGTPLTWEGQAIENAVTALKETAPRAALALHKLVHDNSVGQEKVQTAELDLSPQTIELDSLPVNVDGEAIGRLFLGRDVTEERALEHLREDLIYTMVHDLRNPLHMIASGLDLLREVLAEQFQLGDSEAQMLDIARTSTERMLYLVNAILEINQLESRSLPLEYRLFNLERMIEMVRELSQPLIQKQQLTLEVQVDVPTAVVWADSSLIERVLQNLVGNALKYTPAGGKVCVRITAVADENRVKVSVIDTGSGIPPELHGRLFEKFARGNQQNKGSGLGLAFCKMAIEAHNEKIWVESTSPQGTTLSFTLSLPPQE